MTPAPKHTPNPLRIEYVQKISVALRTEARLSSNQSDAKRLYVIAEAVEKLELNHDKLVEALEASQWALQIAKNSVDDSGVKDEVEHGLEQITAALAAVEGE